MGSPTGNYLFTPGPQFCYVRFRNASQPYLLGTCVTSPELEENPAFIKFFNDIGGRSKEFGRIYDGADALVSVTLNRLDMEVYRTVRDQTGRSGGNAMGYDGPLERGSIVTGITDFELIIYNSFYNTVNASPGLPAGRKYFSATFAGSKESAAGTRLVECAMVFECNSIWLGHTQGFQLYSESVSDFGSLPLN